MATPCASLSTKNCGFVGITGGELVNLGFSGRIAKLVVIEQRQRMGLDVGGDDKLLARQPDAIVGNEGKGERLLGVADVHHHFRLRADETFEVRLLHARTAVAPS